MSNKNTNSRSHRWLTADRIVLACHQDSARHFVFPISFVQLSQTVAVRWSFKWKWLRPITKLWLVFVIIGVWLIPSSPFFFFLPTKLKATILFYGTIIKIHDQGSYLLGLVRLITLPYHRFFNNNTLKLAREIRVQQYAENEVQQYSTDRVRLYRVLVDWRSRKKHELKFLAVAVRLNISLKRVPLIVYSRQLPSPRSSLPLSYGPVSQPHTGLVPLSGMLRS